jgi:hypothetical protein
MWQQLAACRDRDPRLFFDPDSAVIAARTICGHCRVRCECAGYALDLVNRGTELGGVWGGVNLSRVPTPLSQLRDVAEGGGAQIL